MLFPYPDGIGDQTGVIAAIADNVPYNGGAYIGFTGGSEQEHRLDFGKLSIGMCNGLFKFKIPWIAQSP